MKLCNIFSRDYICSSERKEPDCDNSFYIIIPSKDVKYIYILFQWLELFLHKRVT